MSIVQSILDFLKTLLQWWFIVAPWEQAVRARFGKHVKLFGPGAHFRIPFFDAVFIQNTRRRLMSIGSQTLTTKDRKLVTIHSTLGFVVSDVLRLQQTLHDPDGTIMQHVTALLSQDIATHRLEQCSPADVVNRVAAKLNLEEFGLSNAELALTSYVADIRTLRLIQDNAAPYFQYSSLNTSIAVGDTTSMPRAGR
jgi:hypothetical protein